MGYLGKEDILKANDRPTRDIDVPEWIDDEGNCTVRVRALSGTERDAYESSMTTMLEGNQLVPDLSNKRAKLAARGIVDSDTGEPMFNELDVGQLGQRSAAALERVSNAIQELSGMNPGAVEEAVDNLKDVPNVGSISS